MYRIHLSRGSMKFEIEAATLDELESLVRALEKSPLYTSYGQDKSGQSSSAKTSTPKNDAKSGGGEDENLVAIVNAVKESDDFAQIEEHVLRDRHELPRVLMCCWFASEVTGDPYLTTGQIETITNELGRRIEARNVTRSFTGRGKRFFTADGIRRKGQVVRYKLNYAGEQAFQGLLRGDKIQ